MPLVTFSPLRRSVEVPRGTSVLDAARLAGAPLGASCDGDGICAACGVRVLSGDVPAESPLERRSKAANGVDPALRLACLLPARGSLAVTTDYWSPPRSDRGRDTGDPDPLAAVAPGPTGSATDAPVPHD